jgi:hypothetical protein
MSEPTLESLPLPLRWVRAHGLEGLTPWHWIDGDAQRDGLRREYRREVSAGSQPEQDLLPFAARQDCDDIAGFEVADGKTLEVVLVVHLTWRGSPEVTGFPSVQRYASFWEWLKAAIDDSAEWCSEDELPLSSARNSR